jgi:hypothetical protein
MKSGAKLHLGISWLRAAAGAGAGAGAAATGTRRVAGPVVELASCATGWGGGVAGLGGLPRSQGRAATPATVSRTTAAATEAPTFIAVDMARAPLARARALGVVAVAVVAAAVDVVVESEEAAAAWAEEARAAPAD